ncbi:DUF2252 domain-containing protein [Actinokineospora bangkokensis]|uniref:DUF2252 domain-containing protein n=1 Tax=Actinokineospora bangkokensis TaxID=1193682 RepID=A0A1Q9LLD9_9PSEU|nr:DUF2252 domain-containing protein [Actinokineospora bangkokensis]OLR92857.1 hypothetical protein BJP25_19605 [Actinokineospora bangkokensis]
MGDKTRRHVREALATWQDPEAAEAHGRSLREVVPHAEQGVVSTAADRPSAVGFVRASNAGRHPDLVPLRVGRMVASPFAFFRGSAGLMAEDLAAGARTGVEGQICGDAHAANFGLFGTPEGRVVMDINDFDETTTGPWEWDLKRLATSLVLAGREGGVGEKACRDAAEDVVRSYRKTMKTLAEQPFLESWGALGDESVLHGARAHALIDDFEEAARKAGRNTSSRVVARWARPDQDARLRFVPDPPVLAAVPPDVADDVVAALPEYAESLRESRRNLLARYAVSDVAHRVVGTGSVGFRNYLVLLRGNGDEALVLQVKEAPGSAVAAALGHGPAKHEGKRIVHGARLVQAETDILLGWTTVRDRHYIVRQFRNRKGEIDATTLGAGHLDDYGRLSGALLARAHTRSMDPRVLDGYCGKDLDDAVAGYAVAYADRTEADHEDLAAAVRSGELPAEREED